MQCRFGRKFRHGNGILDKEWCLPLTIRRDSIDGAGDSEVLRVAATGIPYLTSQCNLRLLHANSLSFLPFKRRVSRLNCFHFSCTLTAWKDFVVNYCPMWVAYGFLVACLKEMSSKSKIIPPWHACAWFILSCYSEVLLTLMAAPASWSHLQTLEFSWRLSADISCVLLSACMS